MRLHHLTITAFGPFADTVEVDFDELSAAELFLLSGATGAGKSSVLDAVCFALYGQVPGERGAARHLRSDHAPAERAPRVVLRWSIGGRTFRLTRSPAWDRPKKRGTGTTPQPAGVLVEERRGQQWHTLTTRADEAGDLVGGLLGMNATQFTQVALLPQGEFQRFLRADPKDRQAVLQRLFRTDRFAEVERWLADRRQRTRADQQQLLDELVDAVSRLEEVAGGQAPVGREELDGSAYEEGALSLRTWAGEVVRSTSAAAARVSGLRDQALSAAASAEETLAVGRTHQEHRRRGELARQTLAELERTEPESIVLGRRLEAHRRAGLVAAPARRATRTQEALATVERRHAHARAALVEPVDEAGLPAALERARTAHHRAVSLREVEGRLVGLRRGLAEHERTRVRLEQEHAEWEGVVAGVPAQRGEAAERLDVLRAAVAAGARLEDDLQDVRECLRASTELGRVRPGLITAEDAVRAAKDTVQSRREAHLDAREARMAAMAGELAAALVAGAECPVCGSPDHPSPATSPGTSLKDLEQQTRRLLDDAEADLVARLDDVHTRSRLIERLEAACAGRDAEHWRQRLELLERRLAEREAHSGELAGLEESLAALDAREREAREQLARTGADLAALRATIEACRQRESEATAELSAALDAAGLDAEADVDDLVGLCQERIDALEALSVAGSELRAARDSAAEARAEARQAAIEAGFPDAEDALAAVLTQAEAEDAEDALSRRRDRRVEAQHTLTEDAVDAALREAPVDLEAAASHARELRERADALREEAATLLQRASRAAQLQQCLQDRLEQWVPAYATARLVHRLCGLVAGTGEDNAARMRLSAYVLGERLHQVVEAANTRLARMGGGRYALVDTDERGARERRGGLGLRIRDEWTGVARDPLTLSGGETFMVSLALALGLANTVLEESGGVELGTLFVDEGFGSLDTDTLESVLDVLDGLREGGRVIGVVSHVTEMRERIPVRLEVLKPSGLTSERGSTVRLAGTP